MKNMVNKLLLFVSCSIFLAGCASIPEMDPFPPPFLKSAENKFHEKMAEFLKENLRFDPYGNEIYFEDPGLRKVAKDEYEAYVKRLNNLAKSHYKFSEWPDTNYFREHIFFRKPDTIYTERNSVGMKIRTKYTYRYHNKKWIYNYLKNTKGVSPTKANVLTPELYKEGVIIYISGHAKENNSLSQYEVPVTMSYWYGYDDEVSAHVDWKAYIRDIDVEITSKMADRTSGQDRGEEKSTEERLEELKRMKEKGFITDEEYEKKRKEIIDSL